MAQDEITSVLEWTEECNGASGATAGSGAPFVSLNLTMYMESVEVGGYAIWDTENSEASTNEERIAELDEALRTYMGYIKHMLDFRLNQKS